MVASSPLSTFLDVSGATSGSEAPGASDVRTRVLAAVLRGGVSATELAQGLNLPLGDTLSALGWLQANGLVDLREADGGICVSLTDWAREQVERSAQKESDGEGQPAAAADDTDGAETARTAVTMPQEQGDT